MRPTESPVPLAARHAIACFRFEWQEMGGKVRQPGCGFTNLQQRLTALP
ncbi:MAG: hypothetical protein ACYDBQ_11720 [Thermoplasmatota archaeon]